MAETDPKPDVVQAVVRALASYLKAGERDPKGTAAVWACLNQAAGSIEAPPDWSAEHDHYLYCTPKRAEIREEG